MPGDGSYIIHGGLKMGRASGRPSGFFLTKQRRRRLPKNARFMDWVWALYRKYITKKLVQAGNPNPSESDLEKAFLEALAESTVTILVQEPWQNSVRFKGLARAPVLELMDLIRDPMGYLFEHYGGGKFKLNFHQGWHFVATQNFKPQGTPKWPDMPEIAF